MPTNLLNLPGMAGNGSFRNPFASGGMPFGSSGALRNLMPGGGSGGGLRNLMPGGGGGGAGGFLGGMFGGGGGPLGGLFGGDEEEKQNYINMAAPAMGSFSGRYGSGLFNVSPFAHGVDTNTAFDIRKKAKRIFSPAMAGLVAQDALLDPTMELTGRAAAGFGDIWRTEADKARTFNAESLEKLGPRYREAFSKMDPESAALLSLLNEDATNMVKGGSNPYEDREVQQSIRGAQSARGMGVGNSDALAELVGMDRNREGRRINRGNYAGGIVDLGRNYYSNALASLMGTGPQGSQIWSPVQGTSTDDLVSLGLEDTAQRRQQHAARVAGNQQLAGSFMQMIGSLGGGAMAFCWVAEELYGVDDDRTHLARAWVARHDTPFTRAYREHGQSWSMWLRRHPWAKPLVQPIWDAMWQAQAQAIRAAN